VGDAGYKPGRLRHVLIVDGLGLCGAAIPRASVHGAQGLLALCRLQACTITPCLDGSRAMLTQRRYTATRRSAEDVPKSQVRPMPVLSPHCLDASWYSGNVKPWAINDPPNRIRTQWRLAFWQTPDASARCGIAAPRKHGPRTIKSARHRAGL
jgi:hypothetical protein